MYASKTLLLLVAAALFAALVVAGGPLWTEKPIQQWNEQDARQILSGSPWVQIVMLGQLPNMTEEARRQSGRMGVGEGTIDPVSSGLTGSQVPTKRRRRSLGPVEVRWESALPVRAAEKTAHEEYWPAWKDEMYAIAVYDVPGLDIDDTDLARELKHDALLKRGKKEFRPVEVHLLPQERDLTAILYLFPRSAGITIEDPRIEFWAKFGPLSVTQYFYPSQMQLQGKLEL